MTRRGSRTRSRRGRGRSRWTASSTSRRPTTSTNCSGSPRSRSVSTRSAASRGGRWSFRGSTDSRARNRSCGSGSRVSSRQPRGTRPRRRSTVSTRTSTPRSTTRAGARPPSGGSASSGAVPRSPSTATPTRSRTSTPAWISGSTTRASVSRRARIALKAAIWGVCLAPLATLLTWFARDDLTANPISFVTTTLGDWTLRILLASLAMTPLRLVLGAAWPITLRRLLGLFAFFYVCLHASVWIVLDFFFDWPRMWEDIVKRPYITMGMLGLLSLLPLAAPPTAGMVKRLGARRWRRLHRLAYVAGVAGCVHFLWLAKVGRTDQYWYVATLVLLLGIRLGDAAFRAVRRRRERRATAVATAGIRVP